MSEVQSVLSSVWTAIMRSVLIFGTIYLFFSFNTLYAIQVLERVSIPTLVVFVVFQVLILLVGFSFLRMSISRNCTTLELFPEAAEKDSDSDDSSLCINPFEKESLFAYKHEMSICVICNTAQPMRSYHCTKCSRCLLLMYRHLTWCDLCIGFTNYKFYIVFLFYSALLSIISLGCFVDTLIWNDTRIYTIMPVILAVCIQSVWLAMILYYLVEGVYSICINQTPQERLHPVENTNISYNMGYYQNWKSIMGESWYMWFTPSWTTQGDGLKFQHTRKIEPEVYENPITTPL
ncbi:palmitoyltransferase ZDHHC2/15/20 [Nematocida major]|uniref:palmitoyltransferase ZDHHC2/15/20 n=1 Tax=Nematocida major TaxID=1912982 RepID=UPI0020074BA8|nr:palmitoyltransferase ZDHHC2/15/20 [Nematocida major]KAH9385592.1 palmitoyltransferase ZDHHC2/15/20 [Nematocida major]